NREREGMSRTTERARKFRHVLVELRRRQANPESLAAHGQRARAHSRIRRDEPRPTAAKIQIRRLDNLLRVDASDGHGQRSPGDVSPTRGTRRRVSAQVTKRAPLIGSDMNAILNHAPNLTQRPPRSPRARLGSYV